MANIKVDLSTGHKIANPFKTVRKSTTNPFKYSNFEGNTLQFADVFEGFEPKKTSKLKMIASAVTGSMTKLGSSITEPIVNFTKRVCGFCSSAWNYAKNTNITNFGSYKPIADIMNTDIAAIGKGISGKLSATKALLKTDIVDIGKGISNSIAEKTASLQTDLTDLGTVIGIKWANLTGNVKHSFSTKNKSVEELYNMWIAESSREIVERVLSHREVA